MAISFLIPFMDFEFVLNKNLFELFFEVTFEILSRYLRARFSIKNPFAFVRRGQKFFKTDNNSYLNKTKKNLICKKILFFYNKTFLLFKEIKQMAWQVYKNPYLLHIQDFP